MSSKEEALVKENSILKIDLENTAVVERKSENPFDKFNLSGDVIKTIDLKQILDNIEKAKNDDNIKAIYINNSIVNSGLSQIEEIRNKLLDFKESGKQIIAYSETYSQSAYYLSSIADKIYLNPEGIIEIKGFAAEIMFFKGLLEKLNIDIQIIRHGTFKSAVEPFTLDKMSPENKEQLIRLLNSIANNIMDSIASQRGFSLSEIQQHANNLSLENAQSCIELNYVDALIYQDQVADSLVAVSGGDKLNLISLNHYTNTKSREEEISRNKIAIIYATGTIKTGNGDDKSIGSATTAKAIKRAREDKNVKAIVLRINSGGGSALASEVIWRETILTKKAKKPLVVSMGDYAASGGYYIACAADSIVANPTTITGSIGVFGMIPNLENFYKNKLGITIDRVNTNKSADMGINRPLTSFEKEKVQRSVESIYKTFISHVSEGRKMSKVAVNEIGQGRVWSGIDAKEIGLVDEIGGLEDAIVSAAELSEIEDYRVITLPKKTDELEDLLKGFSLEHKIIFSEFLNISEETIRQLKFLKSADKIQARLPFLLDIR